MDFNWQTENGRLFANDPQSNELLAEATWHLNRDGVGVVDYTFVSTRLRGQGVAAKLMTQVAEHFRAQGLKTYGTCSYADVWYQKNHAKYADIIVNRPGSEGTACKL